MFHRLDRNLGRVLQLTGRIGRTTGTVNVRQETGQLLENFHPYPVEQNGSDCRQAIHYALYRLVVYSCHFVILDKD